MQMGKSCFMLYNWHRVDDKMVLTFGKKKILKDFNQFVKRT